MSKGRRLRELLREKPYLVTPGITTALHVSLVAMRVMMHGL